MNFDEKKVIDEIKEFARRNSDFFIKTLLLCYPMSHSTRFKYSQILGIGRKYGKHKEYELYIAEYLGYDVLERGIAHLYTPVSLYRNFLWMNLHTEWNEELAKEYGQEIPSEVRSKILTKERREESIKYWKQERHESEDYITAAIQRSKSILWKNLSKDPYLNWNSSLIKKYEFEWDWGILSTNTSIKWDKKLIDEFSHCIIWKNLSSNHNVVWTKDLLDGYRKKLDWGRLLNNKSISWNENLVNGFKEYLNWNTVSLNERIVWTKKIIETNKERINWKLLSQNTSVPWDEDLITTFEKYLDWNSILANRNVVWSTNLLKKYEAKLDWRTLSRNSSIEWESGILDEHIKEVNFRHLTFHLSWDIVLIEKYKNHLNWRTLSARKSINWSDELIDTFKDKLFWFHLVNNTAIPWTFALIEKCKDYWNWKYKNKTRSEINHNPVKNKQLVLRKLIVNHLTDEIIEEILEEMKMRDQIKGCLIASAIGDGFGYPTEFLKVDEIKSKWGDKGLTEPIGEVIKVTDDTQMAISVSKAVMKSYQQNDIDKTVFEEELVNEFVLWLNDEENNRAPGMTCLTSCENLEKGMPWQEATAHNSKGCGANMRVTPIGLLKFKGQNFTNEKIAKIAQFQSAITHAHPTALVASELTAITIIKIIEGVKPMRLIDELLKYANNQKGKYYEDWLSNIWERPGMSNEIHFINRGWNDCIQVLKNVKRGVRENNKLTDPCEITGEGWIAEESFGTALLCFLLFPDDTVKTLIRAVNTKGDSDSIACIAGAFAGAKNGLKSIPKDWVKRIEYRKELEEYLKFILD